MKPNRGQVSMAALMPHAPVLIPAVGGQRGNRAVASVRAMAEAAQRLVRAEPDAVVLVSPHSPRRRGAFALWTGPRHHGSLAPFGAPEVAVDLPCDTELARTLAAEAEQRGLQPWWLQDPDLDHGALVPLWFLAEAGWRGPTVLLGLDYPGEPGMIELGEAIAAAAQRSGRGVAMVASGDMSHRLQPGAPAGFHPRAEEFDATFIRIVRAGEYRRLLHLDPALQDLAAEDVVDSTVIAASAVEWDATGHEVLSYEGPFGVGYGVAILYQSPTVVCTSTGSEAGLEEQARAGGDWLPRLARQSLEAAFQGNEATPELPATEIAATRHGVFVTIRGPGGKLRGCVGTLAPRWPSVAEETWQVARDAAFRDGRFAPVKPDELQELTFEVSVVMPCEKIHSWAQLDPERYGVVIATTDGRRGTLLPGIECVHTVEQQLEIARRKAGIGVSEPIELERFTVQKFAEPGRGGRCAHECSDY